MPTRLSPENTGRCRIWFSSISVFASVLDVSGQVKISFLVMISLTVFDAKFLDMILILDPVIDRATKLGNKKLASITLIIAHVSVYLSLIFFRSQNLDHAKIIFSSLFNWESSILNVNDRQYSLTLGLGKFELIFGLLFIVIVFSVEYYQEYHKERINSFYNGNGLNRWFFTIALSLSIIFFGFYNGRTGDRVTKPDENKQEQFIYEAF